MAANVQTAAQNGVFTLVVRTLKDQKTIADLVSLTPSAGSPEGGAPDAWSWAEDISRFFGNVAAGAESINVSYSDGLSSGFASNTVTWGGNVSNADTITIGGVLVTFTTGTPSGSQVKVGSTQAITKANLETFVNQGGNAGTLSGIVTAAATSANVTTLSSFYPGPVGNLMTATKSAGNLTINASPMTGGTAVNQASLLSIGI